MPTTLITGGAGFIGAHVARELLAEGHHVRALDSLHPQVHPDGRVPDYLPAEVELAIGDIRDPKAVKKALAQVDHVVHLAARVGVGQSMYQLAEYTSVNTVGTTVLLEAIQESAVRRLVVASSMSVYGEGAYVDSAGMPVVGVARKRAALEKGIWEPAGPRGEAVVAAPTPETKHPDLSSVYALNKYDQERLCLLYGEAYDLPTTALRLFNVYGPHQALSNPYTGVLAIFASRLLNGNGPLIFEDGEQRRDFVHVDDVARAFRLALSSDQGAGKAINVGSGRSWSISEIVTLLSRLLGCADVHPTISGKYRVGDIRHCYADTTLAAELLGFEASIDLENGLRQLVEWLNEQTAIDSSEAATAELASRGLAL